MLYSPPINIVVFILTHKFIIISFLNLVLQLVTCMAFIRSVFLNYSVTHLHPYDGGSTHCLLVSSRLQTSAVVRDFQILAVGCLQHLGSMIAQIPGPQNGYHM